MTFFFINYLNFFRLDLFTYYNYYKQPFFFYSNYTLKNFFSDIDLILVNFFLHDSDSTKNPILFNFVTSFFCTQAPTLAYMTFTPFLTFNFFPHKLLDFHKILPFITKLLFLHISSYPHMHDLFFIKLFIF